MILFGWVAGKSKRKLNKWLRSANCELQVYGAIGLLLLKQKKVPLTGEETEIIAFLKKQNAEVDICAGCLYGLSSSFSEVISYLE